MNIWAGAVGEELGGVGTGHRDSAASARQGAPWRGANLVGKTLMVVRDEMGA